MPTLSPPFPASLLPNWKRGFWLVVPRAGKCAAALRQSLLLLPGAWPVGLDSRPLWVKGCWSVSSCLSFRHVSPAPPRSGVETALDL